MNQPTVTPPPIVSLLCSKGRNTIGHETNLARSPIWQTRQGTSLPTGHVYTLVSTRDGLSGTFGNAAQGTRIPLGLVYGCPQSTQELEIHYTTSGTPETVTATVIGSNHSTLTPTTTAVLASNSTPVVGETVTYTATVTPEALAALPTGTVEFFDGGTPLPTCSAQPLTQGLTSSTATCQISYPHPRNARHHRDIRRRLARQRVNILPVHRHRPRKHTNWRRRLQPWWRLDRLADWRIGYRVYRYDDHDTHQPARRNYDAAAQAADPSTEARQSAQAMQEGTKEEAGQMRSERQEEVRPEKEQEAQAHSARQEVAAARQAERGAWVPSWEPERRSVGSGADHDHGDRATERRDGHTPPRWPRRSDALRASPRHRRGGESERG